MVASCAPETDLCKLPLETCQITYRASVGCESSIFLLHDLLAPLQPLVWQVKVKSAYEPTVAYQAGAYPGFCSM